jgi:tetratricopeptide (TPR) repeat protein
MTPVCSSFIFFCCPAQISNTPAFPKPRHTASAHPCPHSRNHGPTQRAPSPRRAPPQAYNKRATVLYLLQRFQESIADCRRTLKLNPWHFGAASGMGLCHCALGQGEAAADAFERALAIHPGLTQVKQQLASLRQQERGAGGV